MENNQNIVFRFSKINTRIKLIVLWISLVILDNYNNIFYSFLEVIRFSPISKKIYRIIYLKEQDLLNQLIIDKYINGKEMSRIKLLAIDILNFLSRPIITYYLAQIIIILTPVLIIISNLFIKKYVINNINIFSGLIYSIICIQIILYSNVSSVFICIVEIIILFLIIIISIQWLKIKEE